MPEVVYNGARVLIRGARSWSVGVVEDVRPPSELIAIPGAPAVAEIREILAEWNVTRLATVSFIFQDLSTRQTTFLEVGGKWYDLQRQEITFEPRGPAIRS